MAELTDPQSTEGYVKFCEYIKPILERKDKRITELETELYCYRVSDEKEGE